MEDEITGGALRILAVIPGSDNPMTFVFARRQMAAVASHGHIVEVFDLRHRRSLRGLLDSLAAYRKHLRAFRPNVVHAHYGTMTGFFSAFGAIGLAPVLVTFRGSDLNPVPSDPPWHVFIAHMLSQAAAWKAAWIACVSEELRARLWSNRHRVTLIPTGVDTTKFFPSCRRGARQALEWQDDQPIVLAAGQAAGKRIEIAEEAVEIARRSIGEIRLFVLHGQVAPDQVPLIMQASDCLIFTSDFEGSPTMVQEAMACNLPVVSVRVGDVVERLRHVVPSFVTSPSPADLATGLVAILRDRRRSNGYEIALKEVAIGPIMDLLDQAYRKAAAAGR